jgi:hypothetical protein
LAVAVSAVAAGPAAAAKGGNNDTAKVCQKGTWKTLVPDTGGTFANQGDRVNDGGQGSPPIPEDRRLHEPRVRRAHRRLDTNEDRTPDTRYIDTNGDMTPDTRYIDAVGVESVRLNPNTTNTRLAQQRGLIVSWGVGP